MRWLVLLLLMTGAATHAATQGLPKRGPLKLFAYPYGLLQGNRVQCYLSSDGYACQQGFWPQGTSDQYIFSSGLQVAALIPTGAGFAWAGDTTGAYFWDARGDQAAATPRSDVFNSRDSADAVNWPASAVIHDAATFDARLLGRNAASEQDLWTRFWDGNPTSLGGRQHQMGLLVDQRVLAWTYPTGNQDIIYFVNTLYNVTARTAGVYANPTIPPELQSDIAAIGRVFQDSVEQALAVSIPDGGYAFDSMYVQLGMDHDIAIFSQNFGTASVPFGMGIGYTGTFLPEVGWTFPLDPFGAAPFAAAPGLLGTVFVKSPAPFSMFTNTTGGGSFPDPIGPQLLWRRMSGNLKPSDTQCSPFTDPAVARARHVCYLAQFPADSRYQMSVGPFHLGPGEATTIVIAYILAAPLDTVNAYIGSSLAPGVPFPGDSIVADTTKIRPIERIAGWRTQSDLNGNGSIEPNEVVAPRRSLFHKTQVAQALVDAKFLLPSAPEPPQFFLMPGDNQVTVVWQPSATASVGDPYFALASDPTSALYDPNYRQFDVEGYRIYRGRDPRALELIAQVDHDNTSFVDYVGAVDYSGRCAPELAIVTDCPVPFPPLPSATVSATLRIQGTIVQVPEGSRILTNSGALGTVAADTFPTGHASGFPPLGERGVTYAFTDSTVRNSFRYYYAVTAFDFNSIRSGPSSFESPRFTKIVTPRVPSGQETGGGVQPMRLLAADGSALDPAAPLPTINPVNGVFSGPMPPTDGLDVAFTAFLPQLVAADTVTVTIDSISVGMAELDVLPGSGRDAIYYLTVRSRGGAPVLLTVPVQPRRGFFGLSEDTTVAARFVAVPMDSAQAARFGGDQTFALPGRASVSIPGAFRLTMPGRADANAIPFFSAHNGPRWWAGGSNENTAHPNGGTCAPSNGNCANTVRVPNIGATAGAIPGVTIFHVQSYNSVPNTPGRIIEGATATVMRAADFRVVWGAAGGIDSVVDETHRVRVPFDARVGPSWGILNQGSFAGVTEALTGDTKNNLLTWSDIFCVGPMPTFTFQCGGVAQTPAVLQNTAALSPIAIRDTASSYTGTAAPAYTATGDGFIFYLNGHFFLMQTAALPPAGTVWHARFYAGTVRDSLGVYTFNPAIRPPAVPGLRAQIAFTGSQLNRFVTTDSLLRRVHTVPDPFYVSSGYELSADTLALKFVHLPARAIIRIYSLSGILVQVLTHDDPTGGGEATWDLNSRSGKGVASGVYFYHIETPDRRSRVGRFTVITGPRGP